MAKKIVNKSVSFNLLDPFQLQMKKHTEQFSNFSSYIKSLIQRDMENGIKKASPETVINRTEMTQELKSKDGAIKIDLRKLG